MRKSAAALLAPGVLTFALLSAQSKPVDVGKLTFDVVSIKPHKTGDSGVSIGRQPGGRWVMVNASTGGLILSAYPTKIDELIGAPAWVRQNVLTSKRVRPSSRRLSRSG